MRHALFIFVNDVVTKDVLAKEEDCLEITVSTLSACSSRQHIIHDDSTNATIATTTIFVLVMRLIIQQY